MTELNEDHYGSRFDPWNPVPVMIDGTWATAMLAFRLAVVAACMAERCTPEDTDQVMKILDADERALPHKAGELQREIEKAIIEVRGTGTSIGEWKR